MFEFLLWADASNYPFCQILTNLEQGGVAVWFSGATCHGGKRIICLKVLPSMSAGVTVKLLLMYFEHRQ